MPCPFPTARKTPGSYWKSYFALVRLKKIAKYEASLREHVKNTDLELEALADWRYIHVLDRGSIDAGVVERLDWEDAAGDDRRLP